MGIVVSMAAVITLKLPAGGWMVGGGILGDGGGTNR